MGQLSRQSKSNNILTHSNNNNNFAASNANKLLDLTLFRIAPHVIKKYIYNDQKWLISNFHNQEEFMQYRYFYHTAFMNDLTENLTVDRNSSIYKYIHILNTHNPMVTAPDCSYAGEVLPTTRLTLTIQSKCTLDTVVRLFNKMKALGIYDNTLIVMHADHGGWITPLTYNKQIVNSTLSEEIPRSLPGLASPLLAIKPIGGSGKLTKVLSIWFLYLTYQTP